MSSVSHKLLIKVLAGYKMNYYRDLLALALYFFYFVVYIELKIVHNDARLDTYNYLTVIQLSITLLRTYLQLDCCGIYFVK